MIPSMRQFWRRGTGEGDEGFEGAPEASGEWRGGLVRAPTGGFVLAVEGKAKSFEGRG